MPELKVSDTAILGAIASQVEVRTIRYGPTVRKLASDLSMSLAGMAHRLRRLQYQGKVARIDRGYGLP